MPIILYKDIKYEYSVIKSNRKSISLTITPNSQIIMRCPIRVSELKIHSFITAKMPWVMKHLNVFANREPTLSQRQYIPGESHYYLGVQHMMEIVISAKEKVELRRDRIVVHQLAEGKKYTKLIYSKWLEVEIKRVFNDRYNFVQDKFKYGSFPQLEFKDMKRRWGSYRASGYISLNKKLIHAPIESIDYVITHELCHHKHMNHGKEFYALLEKKLPNWKEEKKKLERYGSLVCG